jgi:hypothetical protein
VPKVYCLCTDPSVIGTPFYIMEYLEGVLYLDSTLPVRCLLCVLSLANSADSFINLTCTVLVGNVTVQNLDNSCLSPDILLAYHSGLYL